MNKLLLALTLLVLSLGARMAHVSQPQSPSPAAFADLGDDEEDDDEDDEEDRA